MSVETAKKWDSRFSGPVPHDATYYAKCMLGGVLACGLTHYAITPLDVTKCNMQVQEVLMWINYNIIQGEKMLIFIFISG